MYTVGYSHYYGYSLICRSYTMLFGKAIDTVQGSASTASLTDELTGSSIFM